MATTFEKAKIGDKVFSVNYGWGTIVEIYERLICPIEVEFDNGVVSNYDFKGVRIEDLRQTLFWNEVKITAPEMPKRIVKKKLMGWFISSEGDYYVGSYRTKEEAQKFCLTGTPIIYVDTEYEVEEE